MRTPSRSQRWVCECCGKLLGLLLPSGRLEVRHGALHLEASLPVSRVCEHCGAEQVLDVSG